MAGVAVRPRSADRRPDLRRARTSSRSTRPPGSTTCPGGWAGRTRCSPSWWPGCRGGSARCPCTTGMVDEPRLTWWWTEDDGRAALPLPVLDDVGRRAGRPLRPAVRLDRPATSTATGATAWPGTATGCATSRSIPLVAIVSVGAPRPFLLRPRGGGSSLPFLLGQGDLLVMGGAIQHDWEHSRAQGGRRRAPHQHHLPPRRARRPRAQDRQEAATRSERTAGTMLVGFGCVSIRPEQRRRDRRWVVDGAAVVAAVVMVALIAAAVVAALRRALIGSGRMLHLPLAVVPPRVTPVLLDVSWSSGALAGRAPGRRDPARARATTGRLTLIGAEDPPALRPAAAVEEAAGRPARRRAHRACAATSEYGDLDVELRLGRRATGLDLDARRGGAGRRRRGALRRPGHRHRRRAPPAARPARRSTGVLVLRTLDDSLALRAALDAGPPRVVVIGAGFIGAEVAATARGLGSTSPWSRPWPRRSMRAPRGRDGRPCSPTSTATTASTCAWASAWPPSRATTGSSASA